VGRFAQGCENVPILSKSQPTVYLALQYSTVLGSEIWLSKDFLKNHAILKSRSNRTKLLFEKQKQVWNPYKGSGGRLDPPTPEKSRVDDEQAEVV